MVIWLLIIIFIRKRIILDSTESRFHQFYSLILNYQNTHDPICAVTFNGKPQYMYTDPTIKKLLGLYAESDPTLGQGWGQFHSNPIPAPIHCNSFYSIKFSFHFHLRSFNSNSRSNSLNKSKPWNHTVNVYAEGDIASCVLCSMLCIGIFI